jgi:signal transduction histidine kinase
VSLASGRRPAVSGAPASLRRVVAWIALLAVAVFVGVAVVGGFAARRAAEDEAINDALQTTDTLAHAVIQPAMEDELLSLDPAVAGPARARMDDVVRTRVLGGAVARVKLWSQQGRIVYSDETRLIGETFPLGEEERDVLTTHTISAEISDLSKPENRYENHSKRLLEVYRPVWTPGGQALLFEVDSPYEAVTARSDNLWRGFAGITLSSLLLLLLAQAPLTWALVTRVRRAQQQRVAALDRAVSASEAERRRIAATLHDGVVQELAASAFVVAGAADRARAAGDGPAAERLDGVAATVRGSIGGLRSLLVDIYPPTLRAAGLPAALADLVAPLRTRAVEVTLDVPAELELAPDVEDLLFRVAQ